VTHGVFGAVHKAADDGRRELRPSHTAKVAQCIHIDRAEFRDGRVNSGREGVENGCDVYGAKLTTFRLDGRELFFVGGDRRLTAITVRTTPSLELGTPRPLFLLPGRRVWKDYDVAPDGRFLAIVTDVRGDEQPLTVVLNWTAEAGRLDR